jgi:hypothetical protein
MMIIKLNNINFDLDRLDDFPLGVITTGIKIETTRAIIVLNVVFIYSFIS